MNSLERVRAALNHQKPDRTPRLLYGEVIGYVPAIDKLLKEECAPKSPCEYFGMDITGVVQKPTKLPRERFAEWLPAKARQIQKEQVATFAKGTDTAGGIPVDEWGVWRRSAGFHHFVHIESPLADVEDFERIKEYPWPDLDQPYRFEGMAEEVASLHQAGIAVAAFAGSAFEQAWYMRGMQNMLEDMVLNPEIAHYMLERAAYYQKVSAVEMAKAGVDIVMLGDDVSGQNGMLMSIGMWEEFLKPRLSATIKAVRNVRPEAKIFYHTDGKVDDLVPSLIETGIDILNPVQPDCNNPGEIKQKYGRQLSFWGTISVQQTMPFGSIDDVKNEVKTRIRSVGYDGGLILAPAHVLGPEVPWQNIVAFFEAANTSLAQATG